MILAQQPPEVRNLTVKTINGINDVQVKWKLPVWNVSRPDYYFIFWGPTNDIVHFDEVENTLMINDVIA